MGLRVCVFFLVRCAGERVARGVRFAEPFVTCCQSDVGDWLVCFLPKESMGFLSRLAENWGSLSGVPLDSFGVFPSVFVLGGGGLLRKYTNTQLSSGALVSVFWGRVSL